MYREPATYEESVAHVISDSLDVQAELAALGISEAELDAAMAEQDRAGASLAQMLEPSPDMVWRVTTRVERRLADREALATLTEMMGLGWLTVRAVLGEQETK